MASATSIPHSLRNNTSPWSGRPTPRTSSAMASSSPWQARAASTMSSPAISTGRFACSSRDGLARFTSATCESGSHRRVSSLTPTSSPSAARRSSSTTKLNTLLNPTMIVEVLSRSTESYDRGDKFMHYRRLESLREYVVVAQDKVLVERFTRQGDEWLLTEFRNLDETLRLASIDCAIPLREIYARIEFPGEDTAGARDRG